jgi:hypothetical protein
MMKNILLLIILFSLLTKLYSSEHRTIHIIVALCDNKNQGIVPVPAQLGDGKKPETNLYWGALYGVKTFFKNSSNWKLISTFKNIDKSVAERAIFKHNHSNTFIVADAYWGDKIDVAIDDIINSLHGAKKHTQNYDLKAKSIKLGLFGNANLLAYVGHDGLMEFSYDGSLELKDSVNRDFIILACASKNYFEPYLNNSNSNPILWTTGLMAPEAYTLHAAIEGWINSEPKPEIQLRAAKEYSTYQKCSLRAAKNLFNLK